MNRRIRLRLIASVAILLLGGVAYAHRLDEYLQATLVAVDKDHIEASMRLIPGVAVASNVIATIDTDGDGVLSQSEQQVYATQVLASLSLAIDGHPLTPKLVSFSFPTPERMREGLGEIHVQFSAALPPGGRDRRFTLENRSQTQRTVFLVNALVPDDPNLRIVSQNRNEPQSFYELNYTQTGALAAPVAFEWWRNLRDRLAGTSFASLYRLGMRHIAEGTDHLLFLLALLLPAPLIAYGSRWSGVAGVRQSLLRILRIVTAFTVGHSLTLALATLGFVHVPSRPIEVLIAVSILVSAIHALRPIFPGKEAAIAAFFGLIHGLAFASTLDQLGLGRWERVTGILAFNLGIETMQLVVVGVTLPSLLLMSRTRAYPWLRIGGALFAGLASAAWIAERLFHAPTSPDPIVNAISRHAVSIAAALFMISLACWRQSILSRRAETAVSSDSASVRATKAA